MYVNDSAICVQYQCAMDATNSLDSLLYSGIVAALNDVIPSKMNIMPETNCRL